MPLCQLSELPPTFVVSWSSCQSIQYKIPPEAIGTASFLKDVTAASMDKALAEAARTNPDYVAYNKAGESGEDELTAPLNACFGICAYPWR